LKLIKQKYFSKKLQTTTVYYENTKSKKEICNMSKFVEVNEKIAESVVNGYKKIETGVVDGYKKIETGVVAGFGKVTDKCVEKLFSKDGESVEDTKERLRGKQ